MEHWKRFCKKHEAGIELIVNILGALSLFAFIYVMYIALWLLDAIRL